MRCKISKTSISLICLMLVATSAEAGYKSNRSSYKSSFRPSTITKSYTSSTRSQASRTVNDTPAPASTKPLTTSQKAMIAGSGAALTVGAVSASTGNKPSESTSGKVKNQAGGYAVVSSRSQTKGDNEGAAAGTTPKKSVSGSELVATKGTISTARPPSGKSSSVPPSQSIPGSSEGGSSSVKFIPPSQNLVSNIIEKDNSNHFGFSHLAMLYWLTSSSNSHASSLTSSDKEWIQQQIEEQEINGASRVAAINELKAAGVDTSSMTVADNSQHASTVSFSYDMPTELKAGQVWTFVVNATWNDKKQAPSCELQGAKFMADKDKLYGMWKAPETVGQKTQMKCKAFGVEEIKTLVSV
ncbi:hypothetical protein SIO57_005490 [Klebsiella pneumoniae]|nr:hypothetical protein [Klebsiella pneumoniae]